MSFLDSVGMTDQMLEQSGVNQNFIEHVNSFILALKRIDDNERLAQIIQQRGMQDMTTTIADFEQQIMQKKAREFARLMLGDGRPEQEVQRYTNLSSEDIRQIKSEIQNSRD